MKTFILIAVLSGTVFGCVSNPTNEPVQVQSPVITKTVAQYLPIPGNLFCMFPEMTMPKTEADLHQLVVIQAQVIVECADKQQKLRNWNKALEENRKPNMFERLGVIK